MADKSFGVEQLDVFGTGTPTIQSPNDLNLNAVNVAISTSVTVGGDLDVDGHTELDAVNVSGVATATSFVKTGGTSSQYLMADGSTSSVTSSATFNITTTSPSFSYYTLNGSDRNGSVSGNNAGVTVYIGDTINFNLSNVSVSHPFYLKTLQGTGTSNQVSTPIATGQGSTGTATVSWTPNAAGAYYYQCSNHNAMHGIISVQTASGGGGSTDLLEIMLFT